jgi:HSP20 family protein
MLQFADLLQHPHWSGFADHGEVCRNFNQRLGISHQAPFFSLHSQKDKNVLSPDFDIRETASAYFLEGEFPGISGRDAVKVQWLNEGTLRITGQIDKTDLEAEWEFSRNNISNEERTSPSQKAQSAAEFNNGSMQEGYSPNDDSSPAADAHVHSWLNERRTGSYLRTFSFPSPVDSDGTRVRLRQGLLCVMVPKRERTEFKVKEVCIEKENDGA